MPYALTVPAVRRTAWLAVGAAAVLLLPACSSDDAIGPRGVDGTAPPRFSATSRSGLPPVYSNSVKYRDQGHKPVKARSGSAQLSVRALRSKAPAGQLGATLLELTTGSFDNGVTPPGNLKKVHIKQLDEAGHVLTDLVFKHLESGGYAQFVLQDVIPGATLEVTAQVKGIDGARTSVITVREQVKLRPDLVALELQAPSRAMRHAPVNISALVSEINGDVGARADCVLFVDGLVVDRARGIWVDASSSVNCAFTHAFPVDGTRQLEVRVQSVAPGDWDTGNNAVTGQITIEGLGDLQDFYYEATAREFEARYRVDRVVQGRRFTRSTDALEWTLEQEDVSETNWIEHQAAMQVAWMPIEVQFPLALLEFGHSTNGTSLGGLSRTAVAAQEVDSFDGPDFGFRSACAVEFVEGENVNFLTVDVCARLNYVVIAGTRHEFPMTEVRHQRWAGEVTFLSSGVAERRFGDGSVDVSVWHFNGRQQAGPVPSIPLGPSYTMSFSVRGSESGARTYGSTVVVPLDQVHVPWWTAAGLSTENPWLRPETCTDFRLDEEEHYEIWHSCETWDFFEAGRSGFVTNVPPVFEP